MFLPSSRGDGGSCEPRPWRRARVLWGTPARETPCPVPLPVKVSAATRLCTLAVWPPASYWPSLSSVPAMVPSRCHRHPHVAAGQLSTRPPLGIAGAALHPRLISPSELPPGPKFTDPSQRLLLQWGLGEGGPFAPPSGGGGGAGWRSGGSGAGGGHTEGAEETLGLGDFLAPPGAGCAPRASPRPSDCGRPGFVRPRLSSDIVPE